jgi:ribosomal protein S18 acetylase RimI-like enzyme
MNSQSQATLAIRPYQVTDRDAVVLLWHDCGLVRPWNDPVADITRKLTEQPELFLVAHLEGVLVGTVMAGFEGHRGWINYLAVAPAKQRHAIGRALMTRVEELLLARGCPKINLQIRASNSGVVSFYKSLGYSEDAVISLGKRLIIDEPPAA